MVATEMDSTAFVPQARFASGGLSGATSKRTWIARIMEKTKDTIMTRNPMMVAHFFEQPDLDLRMSMKMLGGSQKSPIIFAKETGQRNVNRTVIQLLLTNSSGLGQNV
jgi:hypothetical protein